MSLLVLFGGSSSGGPVVLFPTMFVTGATPTTPIRMARPTTVDRLAPPTTATRNATPLED